MLAHAASESARQRRWAALWPRGSAALHGQTHSRAAKGRAKRRFRRINWDEACGRLALRVTAHDACHLAHAQGVRAAPRQLLARIPGLDLIDLGEADVCCGSAGSYNLTEPAMARRLRERKIDHIVASGAAYVVAGKPGCAPQIRAGLAARGLNVRVAHPVELLDEAYTDT